MGGPERCGGTFERRGIRQVWKNTRSFDVVRGARAFGEIGHRVTLGRTAFAIVNKFSTMTQNFNRLTLRDFVARPRIEMTGRSPFRHLSKTHFDVIAETL